MNSLHWAVVVSIALFLGIEFFLELGYRFGARDVKRHSDSAHEGVGTIEAAIFALLGLLLAFTFSGASSRFEARQQLIVREVNAIGSAYHLLDVLPFADQPALRHLFADYIDARLKTYEVLSNPGALEKEVQSANHIYSHIWSLSVTACRVDAGGTAARLLLPALNEMNDVNTARTVALDIHLPKPILGLLMSVALLSALMAGYAMSKRKQRSPLHAFLYAVIIAITTYAVLDFDNPRSGFIRIDSADRALVELRKSIE